MHFFLFRPRLTLLVCALALVGLAPAAQAQVTLYTSAAAFRSATLGVSDPFVFDGYADPGDLSYYGHMYSFDDVFFTSASLKVVSPNFGYGDPFGGHQFLTGYPGGPLFISILPGTTAFGADFAALGGGPMNITVNYDQTFHFGSGASFAGFISSESITNIVVDGGDKGPALSGLMRGEASPVPEASSLASLGLLLLGAGGLAAVTRSKSSRRSRSKQ